MFVTEVRPVVLVLVVVVVVVVVVASELQQPQHYGSAVQHEQASTLPQTQEFPNCHTTAGGG
jgi:hypothetical protein